MKKILYVTTISTTINAFLIPHIEMLIKSGKKVDCACYIDKPISKSLTDKGIQIYNIPFCRNPLSLRNIRAFKELVKIQKENNYDAIHVHTPVASIYGRLLKLKFKNIITIYTAHGYHFFEGASKKSWLLYYPIEKLMAKLTDITININKEDYEITNKRLKPKKSYLINGVGLDLNKYKPLTEIEIDTKRKDMGYKKDDFVIIMIAEFNENKNQTQLIKAMNLLKDKYKDIKIMFVGEGSKLEEVKREAEDCGIGNQVKFLGFRTDINNLINSADIGVLLSYREGLPRNIMELMANGKKVITTNIRGCRDLVQNSNIGTLVEIGDYKSTAKAIEKYYLNREIKNEIPKEIKSYEVTNIVEGLKSIYEEIDFKSELKIIETVGKRI